ncbi:MAG TPA: MBL fold metallo-hydrolase [Burkholderiaceae bacterium]|nr:MBL fold metallo-hydrolase [Burkholderiaceae bacterium]
MTSSQFVPRLVNDVFGDPGLFVDLRDQRRALLFDLGDISSMRPGELLRLSDVFVSHTHMDHFAGFDRLLAVVLGRKTGLSIYGGPEFVAQVEHKLRAYTWNVVHRYEVELVLRVVEVNPDGEGRRCDFRSHTGFAREHDERFQWASDVLVDEPLFRVRPRFVDHEMPCLAFALEEKARLRVVPERLAELGVTTGSWLRELKAAVLEGAPGDTMLDLKWRDREGEHTMGRSVEELKKLVLDVVPGRRIGYVTDLRYTEANVRALEELLCDVDQLFIESVFLEEDKAHAERKNHLTARQAGDIARRVRAKEITPFHHSPRYEGRAEDLAHEARAAWCGISCS